MRFILCVYRKTKICAKELITPRVIRDSVKVNVPLVILFSWHGKPWMSFYQKSSPLIILTSRQIPHSSALNDCILVDLTVKISVGYSTRVAASLSYHPDWRAKRFQTGVWLFTTQPKAALSWIRTTKVVPASVIANHRLLRHHNLFGSRISVAYRVCR